MSIFKRSLAIGAAAVAIAFAGGAAQATNGTITLTYGNGVYTGGFNDVVQGSFSDAFTFTLPSSGTAGAFTLSSSSVTFSSVITGLSGYLDTPAQSFSIIAGGVAPYTFDFGTLNVGPISSGAHTIHLSGVTGTSSVAGTINIAAAAVPETATWAMMIAGVGFVGGAMRRRAVRTSVSFA